MDNNVQSNHLSNEEIKDLRQNLNYDIGRYLEYAAALNTEWSREQAEAGLYDIMNSELAYLPYRTFTTCPQENRYMHRRVRTHRDYIFNIIPENNNNRSMRQTVSYQRVCYERLNALLCSIPIQYRTLLHEEFTTAEDLCDSAREFLDVLDWWEA